jgi:hypothetical protein
MVGAGAREFDTDTQVTCSLQECRRKIVELTDDIVFDPQFARKVEPDVLNRLQWEAYKGGVVRDIYFRQDRPGVAIFLEVPNVDQAKAVLAEFPLVKAGLINSEVIPLGAFANWELLFASAVK